MGWQRLPAIAIKLERLSQGQPCPTSASTESGHDMSVAWKLPLTIMYFAALVCGIVWFVDCCVHVLVT